jgi:Ca2+-binding RTX toxin-like protein
VQIIGTLSRDSLTGTGEDDTLYGGGALTVPLDESDTLNGGGGNDALYGNGGHDWVMGAGGADTIYGGIGNDTLYGGNAETNPEDQADLIYGQDGRDILYGNGGNDTLLGGDWTDTIFGGEGNDVIKGGNDFASLGDGGDWIAAGPGQDIIEGQEGDDTIYGGTGRVDGDDEQDTIDGGDGNDIIYGNGGDDSIVGGAGNDTLYSGLGLDTLEGGDGDDSFTLGFSDRVTGGAGIDTFILDISTLREGTIPGEMSQITDLEAGESLQITGIRANQTASVGEDADGNAVIEIDGQAFARLNGIRRDVVSDISLSNPNDLSQTLGNPTFGIAANTGPGNSRPRLEDLDDVTFAENTVNTTPQLIDADVTFTDGGSLNNGFLEIAYSSGGGAEDSLSIRNQGGGAGQIGFDGSDVSYEGTVIGTVFGSKDGSNGNDLLIIFNADANQENVEALLENLTYANSSDAPAASREISILLNDGSLDSEAVTSTVTVTAENDAPTVDNALVDQAGNVTSAFSYTFAANTFGDPDGDSLTYTVQSGLPVWASFDAGTRTLSGTPAAGQGAVSNVVIRATDGSGAFVEDTVQITIGTTITGTAAADTLTGSAQDETFLALAGEDNIDAQGGDDTITLADWEAVTLPTAVSPGNLQLWLDASDASTITESGGAVSEWRDKSGQGNDSGQDTASRQPELVTVNGRQQLEFDADSLSVAINNAPSNYTFFATANFTTASVAGRYLFDTNVGRLVLSQTGNSGLGYLDYFDSGGWKDIAPAITGKQLITWHLDSSTGGEIFRDGLSLGSSSYTQMAIGGGTALGSVVGAGGSYIEGSIGDFIIFNTALSDTDRQTVERYLSNKYGIELDASVPNANDVIDGGAGTDTLTISSGQFMLNPGTISTFNSIETFNLSGNDAAHELTLTDDYYDTNGGVEADLVTVILTGNSNGSEVNAATLTGTHAISVQGSDGNDSVHGGAAPTDHLDYSARSTAVAVDQPTGNFSNLDSITGGTAGDTLTGGLGDQTLQGGDGADFLYGDVDVESFDVSAFASGNKLWLDGSDQSTLFADTAGATPITDGTGVALWQDKSGNGNHATDTTAGTSTDRPTWDTDGRNGLASLSFDGGDHLFITDNPNLVLNNDVSVFTVARVNTSANRQYLISAGSYNGEFNIGFIDENGINTTRTRLFHGDGTTHISPGTNSSYIDLDKYQILSVLRDNSAKDYYAFDNGNIHQTITYSYSMLTISDSTVGTAIGARGDINQRLEGQATEYIAYNRLLTANERQQIETYLAEKWGIGYAGTVNDEDSLSGGDGDDYLSGGVGDDTLEGGLDNDSLTGGSGNDVFIFKNNSGLDTVTDFENPGVAAGDVIHILSDINGSGITDWTTLSPNISQNGADTEIDLDSGNPGTHVITLTGITAADLTAADFVFI